MIIERDYMYEMPVGWCKAFGSDLMDEIKDVVNQENIEDFIIMQAKEKFGELRLYYYPPNKNIDDVVKKYVDISRKTCCNCGKPATKISTGWISPWCDDCASKIHDDFVDIKEWFK